MWVALCQIASTCWFRCHGRRVVALLLHRASGPFAVANPLAKGIHLDQAHRTDRLISPYSPVQTSLTAWWTAPGYLATRRPGLCCGTLGALDQRELFRPVETEFICRVIGAGWGHREAGSARHPPEPADPLGGSGPFRRCCHRLSRVGGVGFCCGPAVALP